MEWPAHLPIVGGGGVSIYIYIYIYIYGFVIENFQI